LAISRGGYDVADLLLAGGADTRAALSDGWTALHIACKQGEMGVLKRLLHYGGDMNAADGKGQTPLSLAEEFGHNDIVIFLRERGAK
jgi:ankyrin repeat protein